jgi:hypothetical protein
MESELTKWLRKQSTFLNWATAAASFVMSCAIAVYFLYSVYLTNELIAVLSFYIFPMIVVLSLLVARLTWEKTIIMQNRQRATKERERLAAHCGATWADPTLQPGDIMGDDLGAR